MSDPIVQELPAPLVLSEAALFSASAWHNPLFTTVSDAWCDLRCYAHAAKPPGAPFATYIFELTLFQRSSILAWYINYSAWASEAAHKILSHQGFAATFQRPEHYSQLRDMIIRILTLAATTSIP